MKVFESTLLGSVTLRNRIIRSATFEGMADKDGFPTDEYREFYVNLAKHGVGGIITGFTFINQDGRGMHPGQAGMDYPEKVPAFKSIVDEVHKHGAKIFMQLAHTGRQTKSSVTGEQVLGVSGKKSEYFNEHPRVITMRDIERLVDQFGISAKLCQEAGFDGVQLLASHGYLIHQFLHPEINDRTDLFGMNKETGLGTRFLRQILFSIKGKVGPDYPVLIKISASDDLKHPFTNEQFIQLLKFLDSKDLAGIEISYGTMDYPLNIFRCSEIPIDTILEVNPRYKIKNKLLRKLWKTFIFPFAKTSVIQFSSMYNLEYAIVAKEITDIPIITVGGFRRGTEIKKILEEDLVDFVSMCRPFLAEPDFVEKIQENKHHVSTCINCSKCAIMVDSEHSTKCWVNS